MASYRQKMAMTLQQTNKLFLQLRPDEDGTLLLKEWQSRLSSNKTALFVPESQLHLTLIHVGVLQRVVTSIKNHTAIRTKEVLCNAEKLANDFKHIATTHQSGLYAESNTFELFGKNGSVAVVSFKASSELEAAHKEGLSALTNFLHRCGLEDPGIFMKADANLRHALTLRPHISLAKNYSGKSTTIPSHTFSLTFTPAVY